MEILDWHVLSYNYEHMKHKEDKKSLYCINNVDWMQKEI